MMLLRALLLWIGYRTRPSLIVIGAQKAGTTALYRYLAAQPGFVASGRKEVGFFCPEQLLELPNHPSHAILCGDDPASPLASRRKRAWYGSQFPLPYRLHGRVAFEATPDYLYVPAAAARIHEFDPEIRLVVLLREPADRAFSAWNMYRRYSPSADEIYAPRRETRPFDVAVRHELDAIRHGERQSRGYVARGLYAEQLGRYFALFPRDNILVLDSDALATRTDETVARITAFAGVADAPRGLEWDRHHVGEYETSPEHAETLESLRAFYCPHNERLRTMLDEWPTWLRTS